MKFSAVTLACMATGVVATPPTRVYERQVATITGVLNDVGTKIDGLTNAFKNYNGDASTVTTAAGSLTQALKDGQTKAQGSSMLSLTDALGLQEPVKGLTTKAQNLVTELKAKKSTIQSNGLCSAARSLVGEINTAANSLITTVVGKVPQEAGSIATNLVAPLKEQLSQASDQLSTSNCQDSGSSSSAPASSGSSTAPASSGSSAPASSVPASSSGGGGAYPVPTAPASTGGSYSVPANSGGYATATGGGGHTGSAPTGVPVVTGAAPIVAPAGIMAAAMAAILL